MLTGRGCCPEPPHPESERVQRARGDPSQVAWGRLRHRLELARCLFRGLPVSHLQTVADCGPSKPRGRWPGTTVVYRTHSSLRHCEKIENRGEEKSCIPAPLLAAAKQSGSFKSRSTRQEARALAPHRRALAASREEEGSLFSLGITPSPSPGPAGNLTPRTRQLLPAAHQRPHRQPSWPRSTAPIQP